MGLPVGNIYIYIYIYTYTYIHTYIHDVGLVLFVTEMRRILRMSADHKVMSF
jgi:hypothetical protein